MLTKIYFTFAQKPAYNHGNEAPGKEKFIEKLIRPLVCFSAGNPIIKTFL
jgi:hypothetical protein